MASMSNASPALLDAISATIDFMTRPLAPILHGSTTTPINLADLRLVLRTSLQTYACALDRTTLSLPISASSASPPRPILAACLAAGINWSQWARALGPRDFELTIAPCYVTATFFVPHLQKVVVWSKSTPTTTTPPRAPTTPRATNVHASFDASKEGHIPISKLGQMHQARRPSTVRPPPLSLAQELFEADRKEESEMFEMISKMAILSPTPIRDTFSFMPPAHTPIMALPQLHTPLSSPEISPSERSLSPSSTFSAFSDDEESVTTPATSVRSSISISSMDDIPDVPLDQDQENEAAAVYINKGKKDLTKYLYQGGQSTVLTGGVMLGNPNANANANASTSKATGRPQHRATPVARQAFVPPQVRHQRQGQQQYQRQYAHAPAQVQAPKYRAPIGGTMGPRRFNPTSTPNAHTNANANAIQRPNQFPARASLASMSNDWRRPAAAVRIY